MLCLSERVLLLFQIENQPTPNHTHCKSHQNSNSQFPIQAPLKSTDFKSHQNIHIYTAMIHYLLPIFNLATCVHPTSLTTKNALAPRSRPCLSPQLLTPTTELSPRLHTNLNNTLTKTTVDCMSPVCLTCFFFLNCVVAIRQLVVWS